MFASCRGDDLQAAPKATGQAVRAARKAVHARGGAHIRTQHASASTAQHARRKHVARTDEAQHVTKPPQRGQIRVLWSKSINDATARLSCKIEALQAAKRRKGATRAHAQRAKGRGKPSKGRKMYDGGDG